MKIKELIDILQQVDPEKEVAIEVSAFDEFGFWTGVEYVSINSRDCTEDKDRFVINMEDYKYI